MTQDNRRGRLLSGRPREQGFGFADVLGTMALSAMIIVGGYTFMGRVGDTVGYGGSQVAATRLAQEVLERVTAEDFDIVGEEGSVCRATAERIGTDGAAVTTGGYSRTCQVTVADTQRKLILVTVTWEDAGSPRRIQLAGTRLK